jgi:hypothetical protein
LINSTKKWTKFVAHCPPEFNFSRTPMHKSTIKWLITTKSFWPTGTTCTNWLSNKKPTSLQLNTFAWVCFQMSLRQTCWQKSTKFTTLLQEARSFSRNVPTVQTSRISKIKSTSKFSTSMIMPQLLTIQLMGNIAMGKSQKLQGKNQVETFRLTSMSSSQTLMWRTGFMAALLKTSTKWICSK